ncbi:MAG TPA: SurA N-terminal domain-containing protein, partial [Blastocatellia bacterium]
MLRFFAKLERSRSFLLLIFCGLLLVGLIAFYIPSSSLGPGTGPLRSSDDDAVIAEVGSQEITLKEYKEALSMRLSAFGSGNSLPLSLAKTLGYDKQALDQLISQRLVIDQGRELNLTGTDREVSDLIVGSLTDEQGKFIGRAEYLRQIKRRGMSVEEYENDRRDYITSRKVREFIISSAQVSDREVEEKYKKDNTKVDVVYAIVDRDKIRSKFNPTEQDLRAYYEAHK